MRKYLLIAAIIVPLLYIASGAAHALSDPPEMLVKLGTSEEIYRLNVDPIDVGILVANAGVQDIIAGEGFSALDFRYLLYFTYEDGSYVRTNVRYRPIDYYGDPPSTPAMALYNGEPIEVQNIEVLPGSSAPGAYDGWYWKGNLEGALNLYPLTRPGRVVITIEIPLVTYASTLPGVGYVQLCDDIERTDCWSGMLGSSTTPEICLVDDADGDGYYTPCAYGEYVEVDCDDSDSSVYPGAGEITGNGIDDDCIPETPDVPYVETKTATISLSAYQHMVGPGTWPGSNKESLAGVLVKAFETSQCLDGLIERLSLPGYSWQSYEPFWKSSCITPYSGITDEFGSLDLVVEPGEYMVVGKYSTETDEVMFLGSNVGDVGDGEIAHKYLKVIVKSDNKKVPAKTTRQTGSELLIIEPEYVEWDGTQELYPFVFESIGDWDVTTSVSPPEGFVADYESLTEEVTDELEAVQFTITDVGSKWVGTEVIYDLKHKDKKIKIQSKIGIKCSDKLAKEKNFDKYCKEK